MIDPQRRWRPLDDKPDYAGFLSFGGALLAQEPEHLAGVDVAIVGAPTDDLVSDRPGTRFAPRAIRAASCPPGPHLEAGIDAFAALSIVDYGDAPVDPRRPGANARGDPGARRARSSTQARCRSRSAATTRSRSRASRRSQSAAGRSGLIHFDTHTDTGREVFGVEHSHGTPMYRLVEAGRVVGRRYAQIGLRGYWPGPAEFEWQRRARDRELLHARRSRPRHSRASSSERSRTWGRGRST